MAKTEAKKLFADQRACLGCRFCEIICSLAHSKNEVNPHKSRIRVREDLANSIFRPVVCRECSHPKCIEACEHGAIKTDPRLKVPIINKEKCTACLACLEACPFDAIFYAEKEQLVLVCDLCGGKPQCVAYCPVHPTKTHAALNYITPQQWKKLKKGPVERSLEIKSESDKSS